MICIPLAGYYSYGNQFAATVWTEAGFYMSFGQWAEVGFMLIMPLCFRHLGVKKMLAIGMLAWVVRYGLWSFGAPDSIAWMVLGGILLHGICYDFFFVTGQIYVDQQARPGIVETNTVNDVPDWSQIWFWPGVGAAAILLLFVFAFRESRKAA